MLYSIKKIPLSVKKPIIYAASLVIILILGWVGFSQYYHMLNEERGVSSIIYDILRLFFLEHDFEQDHIPLILNIARFLAPLLFATALIDVFYFYLKERLDWLIIRRFYKDHIVLCGLSNQNYAIARIFFSENKKVVIIESSRNNDYLDEINLLKKVKIIKGNALDEKNLGRAGLIKASRVFIDCGDDLENLRVAGKIQAVFDSKKSDELNIIRRKNKARFLKLTISITDFENEYLFKKLQDKKGDLLDIKTFNAYNKFAAYLVDEYSPDKLYFFRQNDDTPAHLLIWGDNKIAINILVEATHLYHFANLHKLSISLITSDPVEKKKQLKKYYPEIEKVINLSIIDKATFYSEGLEHLANNVSLCIVCEENVASNFIVAKRFRQLFFNTALLPVHLKEKLTDYEKKQLVNYPLIVIADTKSEDISILFENYNFYLEGLGICRESLVQEIFKPEFLINGIEEIDETAKHIHNLYAELNDSELDKKWESLTDAEKDQNRWAARHLRIKMNYLGVEFKDEGLEPSFEFRTLCKEIKEILAKMEHKRWIAEKLLTGFSPGQPMEDKEFYNELKKYLNWHKDIRAWEELDKSAREIDFVLGDIEAIAKGLHKKIVKVQSKNEQKEGE